MQKIYGFKGFNCNDDGKLYCAPRGCNNSVVYPVGVTVSMKGPLVPCKRGLHFCKDLKTIEENFYRLNRGIFYGKVFTRGNAVPHGDGTWGSPYKLAVLSLTLEEVIPTVDVLKEMGYKRVAKFKRNLKTYEHFSYLLSNSPELYKKWKTLIGTKKDIEVEVESWERGLHKRRVLVSVSNPAPVMKKAAKKVANKKVPTKKYAHKRGG